MPLSRKKRTSLFRQRVEKEWREYYWEFVLKFSDKLDWYAISNNPNITMDIIETNLNKPWSWYNISCNPFNYEKELFIEKRIKEYVAAYRIQLYYWKGLWNPSCQIGYNKVNRDYDKLFTEDGRVKRIKLN